jgi:hypothetical protein
MADSQKEKAEIEVPISVISRFFSKKESIENFLEKVNKETTHAMLDDLC